MNIEKVKSDLTMSNLFFPECYVRRECEIASEKLNIDIGRKVLRKSEKEYDVIVRVKIDKEQKDLEVSVIAKATFVINNPDTELSDEIIKSNTVAIMFPFIRSQVSLMTTQPGLTPVVLPPINTARLAMLSD